jgi:hypothetical protein
VLVLAHLPVGHGAEVPTASATLTPFCPARSHSHHTVEARVAASLAGSSKPGAGVIGLAHWRAIVIRSHSFGLIA